MVKVFKVHITKKSGHYVSSNFVAENNIDDYIKKYDYNNGKYIIKLIDMKEVIVDKPAYCEIICWVNGQFKDVNIDHAH